MSNTRATFSTLGASNHVDHEREKDDFYATDPKAIDILMEVEQFNGPILEPACGMGHMSERLKEYSLYVHSSDLVDRGYGTGKVDFFKYWHSYDGDIITNPPFKHAVEFIRHSINIIPNGYKVAMFLKILFLETATRKALFEEFPPKTVYILANRLCCAKDGDFVKNNTKAVGYAWYVWEKQAPNDEKWITQLKWVN